MPSSTQSSSTMAHRTPKPVRKEAATPSMTEREARQEAAPEPMTLARVLRRVMEEEQLTQTAIARESGLSVSTLSYWLKGSYKGDVEAVEVKVTKWLRARQDRAAAATLAPEAPAFVLTPTSAAIAAALAYGQMQGDMVEIYGAPGVGKTSTAQHYKSQHPNVWIATMAPDSYKQVAALEEIAEALGVKVTESQGARRLARIIRERVAGTKGLLIIDEAQHLSVQALEEIRSLHDATGLAIALMGSVVLHSRLTGGTRAAGLAQLFSRLGVRRFIKRPGKQDVAALLDAWGITEAAERQYLADVAQSPGALRGLTKCLLLASVNAAGAGERRGLAHLQDAWRTLGATE